MNKYLIDLLKENNTIIIPGLGALTVTDPSTNELMFMPYLQHDDGKLSGFIAEKDGVDEQDAKNTIAKYVREIQSELDKGERVDLYGLGTLVKENGEIEFTNWTGSSNTPAVESVEETPANAEETSVGVPEIVEAAAPETPEVEEEVTPAIVEEVSADIPQEQVEAAPEVEAETPVQEDQRAPEIAEEPVAETSAQAEEESTPIEDALEALAPMVAAHVPEEAEEPHVESVKIETPVEEIPPVKEEIWTPPVVEEIPTAPVVEATAVVEPEPKKPRPSAPVLEKTVAPNAANPSKEKKPKTAKDSSTAKKRGAGFWILITLLVLLAGGGTYFALNYNELKQHIPFLADEKTDDTPEAQTEAEADDTTEEETAEEEPVLEEEEVMEEETPEEPVAVEKPAPVANSNGAYHIVSGAFSSIANANRLMESFKAQGLPARVIENNGLNVVCMQSFATSAEAKASLPAMKEKAPSAWILHKP